MTDVWGKRADNIFPHPFYVSPPPPPPPQVFSFDDRRFLSLILRHMPTSAFPFQMRIVGGVSVRHGFSLSCYVTPYSMVSKIE